MVRLASMPMTNFAFIQLLAIALEVAATVGAELLPNTIHSSDPTNQFRKKKLSFVGEE